MGNDLQIRRVEVTLWPGQDGSPVTVRAYEEPDGHLPVLLPPEIESNVVEAVAITMAPKIAKAMELASLLASLLDHVAERLSTDDGILLHPDGQPVVSENWVAAYNGLQLG